MKPRHLMPRYSLPATEEERIMDGSETHAHSTLKIGDHPVHPMLIPFPIVCFILTFATDVAYSRTADAFWATGSRWLLGVGLVMAALAAVAGLTDYVGDSRLRSSTDALKHMLANVSAVV